MATLSSELRVGQVKKRFFSRDLRCVILIFGSGYSL